MSETAKYVSSRREFLKNAGQIATTTTLAGLAVLAWPIWVAVQAGEAFGLNLVRIPALYGRWLHEIGMVHSKIGLTVAALKTPGYLALLVLAAYLGGALLRRWRSLTAETKAMAVTAALLPLVFFVVAYIPPTMWQQYLAVPVPFIVIALAYPLAALREKAKSERPFRWACGVVGICLAVAVLANLTVLYRSLALLVPEHWAPTMLHRVSSDIAARTAPPQRVLTLGPLYALEGGCDIYPELASGSVVYRIADSMSVEERATARTVGPATLEALIKQHPPAAVILGVEPSYFSFLEEPMRRVVSPHWRRDIYEGNLQLYLRP